MRGMSSTKEYLTRETLALVCGGLDGARWAERARHHGIKASMARNSLRLQYSDEDPNIRRGAVPVVRLAPIDRPMY